jgi:probable HAF family extracellular repeat protein
MAVVEATNRPGRGRLPVVAALVVTALMAPAAGALAAGDGPQSPVPVFILDGDRFTGFDAPGPAAQDFVRINNRGDIVGGTREAVADKSFRGFLRDRRGDFTRIDFPGAAGTQPNGINDRRQIVGTYSNANSCTGCADDKRGFLLARGRFTTIHVPGAAQTQAIGINNRGQIVGEYIDAEGELYAYLWDKGRFTTFDGPDGAGAASFLDINDRGQVVGAYSDGDPTDPPTDPEAVDGFLLSNGDYTTFDAPGAGITLPFAINNRGHIVVSTTAGMLEEAQGLLREGAAGPFTPIDPPGVVGEPGTLLATGINDAGTIVGLYANPDAAPDRQPSPMGMPMMMSGSDG